MEYYSQATENLLNRLKSLHIILEKLVFLRNESEKLNVKSKKELEAGKTKIAVFYGAAHLDDLARRVEKTLKNPRRLEPRWLVAWSMESTQK